MPAEQSTATLPWRRSRPPARIGRVVLLLVGLVFAVGPTYWMVASAFKPDSELGRTHPTWFPHAPTTAQFRAVLDAGGLPQALVTSAVVALVTTAIVLILGSMAAYAVTQWRFPGASGFLTLTLFTQLLPQAAVLVPVYLLWNKLGLIGSITGLTSAYTVLFLPVCVWMLVGFFRSIPFELTEAALIDGASRMRILWSVVLPIARPGMAAVAVYAILACWGEFLFALVFLSGSTTTATVSLASLIGEHNPNIGPLMAASAVTTLPPLVIFFVLQRHFVAGLTGGGVKS